MRDFGRALARRYPRRALVGVSQGAFFVDTFIAEGFNAVPGGGRAYAQALTVDGTGNWMALNQLAGAGAQNAYLRANGRPLSYRRMLRRARTDPTLIDVANYTDFYRAARRADGHEAPPPGSADTTGPRHTSPSPRGGLRRARVQRGPGDPAQSAALRALPPRPRARHGPRPPARLAPIRPGAPPAHQPRLQRAARRGRAGAAHRPALPAPWAASASRGRLPLGRLEPVSLSRPSPRARRPSAGTPAASCPSRRPPCPGDTRARPTWTATQRALRPRSSGAGTSAPRTAGRCSPRPPPTTPRRTERS